MCVVSFGSNKATLILVLIFMCKFLWQQPKRDFFIVRSLAPSKKTIIFKTNREKKEIVKMLTSTQRDVSRQNNNNNNSNNGKRSMHAHTDKHTHTGAYKNKTYTANDPSKGNRRETADWLRKKDFYLMYPKQRMPSTTLVSVSFSLRSTHEHFRLRTKYTPMSRN